MDRHLRQLQADIPVQFADKPKINALLNTIAKQLDDAAAFFVQLRLLRDLHTAWGVQLDNLGDIVQMSRASAMSQLHSRPYGTSRCSDAIIRANPANTDAPIDDELYRQYLHFKIFLNTSRGTYADMVHTLRMFWPHAPILYSETQDEPATMIWRLVNVSPFETDVSILNIAHLVKAAGVSLRFVFVQDVQAPVVSRYATTTHTARAHHSEQVPITETTTTHQGTATYERVRTHHTAGASEQATAPAGGMQ